MRIENTQHQPLTFSAGDRISSERHSLKSAQNTLFQSSAFAQCMLISIIWIEVIRKGRALETVQAESEQGEPSYVQEDLRREFALQCERRRGA